MTLTVGLEGPCWGRNIWQLPILSPQFCYDLRTGLKNKVYIKKRITFSSSQQGLEITSDKVPGWWKTSSECCWPSARPPLHCPPGSQKLNRDKGEQPEGQRTCLTTLGVGRAIQGEVNEQNRKEANVT